MALGFGNHFEDDFDAQRMRYELEVEKQRYLNQISGMRNSQFGNALGSQKQLHAQQAPQPVPQPEPNKVLLLLGEDA